MNTGGPRFRKARIEDLPGIIVLWREMMDFHAAFDTLFTMPPDAAESFSRFLAETMESDDSLLLVAEMSGKLAGYLKAQVSSYPPVLMEKRYGYISDAAVTASSRRSGIGRTLVEHAAAWFRDKGLSRMEMRLHCDNPVSTAFWEAMGFTPYMITLYRKL